MRALFKYCLMCVCVVAGFVAHGQNFRPNDRYAAPYRPYGGQSFRNNRVAPYGNYNNNNAARSRYVDKIQAAKETYMNMQLQLSPGEADRFWPLYRRYEQDLMNIRKLKRENNSNSQVNGREQIDKELYYEQRLVEIHRQYTDEFLKIMPPQKVSLIFKSERQFNDELIRQMGERNRYPR